MRRALAGAERIVVAAATASDFEYGGSRSHATATGTGISHESDPFR